VTADEVTVLDSSEASNHFVEVEIELRDGSPDGLDEIAGELVSAGAEEGAGLPKLFRALGRTSVHDSSPRFFEELRGRLRDQLREIERHDPGTRLGRDPESLHDMRVGVRRLRALLRRGRPHEVTLRLADLEVDTVRRTVRRAGKTIDLKPKEYSLLEFLMQHTDRPLTRSLIIEHVWDIHFDSVSNVVEVHVNSLRNKIDRGYDVALIHTVRGVGYMLTDSPP